MQYMLMCCFEEGKWARIPGPQQAEIIEEYGKVLKDLKLNGHYLAGGRLDHTSRAVTVRQDNGKPAVTDGPFAETKEQLGGYHLIECRDRDEAIAIATRIPTLPFGGAIEVRAVVSS